MALMYCPNCGKKISDTCTTCIHCGSVIKEKLIDYGELKREEIESLRKEYLKTHPKEEYNVEKVTNASSKWKKFRIAINILWISAAIIGLYFSFFSDNAEFMLGKIALPIDITCLVIAGLLISVESIVGITATRSENEALRKSCASKKRYTLWLEKEKGIKYFPPLTEEEEHIYDSVDIYKE